MKIDIYANEPGLGRNMKLPPHYEQACREYSKRLAPHMKIDLHTGRINLKKQKNNARFVTITKTGASLSSEELAREFQRLCVSGVSEFVFFLGCEQEEATSCDYELSLVSTDISIPLQIVLLYEQIYRVIKIVNNEPYHR